LRCASGCVGLRLEQAIVMKSSLTEEGEGVVEAERSSLLPASPQL
jgi:hypothetical protein